MEVTGTGTATDQDVALVRAVLRGRRAGRGLFLVDDPENIDQAVRAGVRVLKIFHTSEVPPRAPDGSAFRGVPHARVPADVAKDVFGVERSSRVFAVARRPRAHGLDALARRDGDVVVLDGVRLAGNIGAVVRSSAAMGAAGVVLVDSGLTTVTDRRLVRASRGLVLSLPVVLATAEDVVEFCRAADLPLVVADAEAAQPVHALGAVTRRVALVFGSERRGCSEELRARAAGAVTIPTAPHVESLNVSVAAAITLFCRRTDDSGDHRRPSSTPGVARGRPGETPGDGRRERAGLLASLA